MTNKPPYDTSRGNPQSLHGSPLLRSIIVGVLCLVLVGCPELDNAHLKPPPAYFDDFVSYVQPMIRQRCSHLPCHGTTDRQLTLYAIGFLRAIPPLPGTPLDEHTLTEAELDWNYDAMRLRIIDAPSAEECGLLRKCLAPEHGGIVHAGDVVVFADRSDPDYTVLRKWIDGEQIEDEETDTGQIEGEQP